MQTKEAETLEDITKKIEYNILGGFPLFRIFTKAKHIQRTQKVIDSFSDRPDIAMSVADRLNCHAESIRGVLEREHTKIILPFLICLSQKNSGTL